MGFNVPIREGDSRRQYIEDMEKSGCGICNRSLVQILSERVIGRLATWRDRVEFDRDETGAYDTIHTLGTAYPRLIHYKSNTAAGR
jgi:aspartate oxidase